MAEAIGEATSLAERKRLAGQRLVIGLAGPVVDEELREIVALVRPAGFVLFARNVVDPAQVRDLNRELAALLPRDAPAVLAIDQEGGRVQRVRATRWPAMRVVGRGGAEAIGDVGRRMARELRAMGFNLNFAPVADVDSNPDNPIIGDRSFGRRPARVAQAVAAFTTAHQAAGVSACAKHFPGHGDTSVDSHLALPTVDRTERSLRETELPPFRAAIEAGVGSVMSAHVVFPAWDADRPATLSSKVIPRLLRGELGYDGLLFSDDMEMGAVRDRWPVDEQVAGATDAGVDLLLACEAPALQIALFEALVRHQEARPGDRRAGRSLARLTQWRQRFAAPDLAPVPLHEVGGVENQELALALADRHGRTS
jgi:beta-N-acetylhexosaminidase